MKSIKKFLFVMVALATALAFVSCNDDDDEPSTVAVYKADDDGEVSTVTFLDNNTWTWKIELAGQSKDVYAGTFSGDPSKDSEITITPTKAIGKDIPPDYQEEEKLVIANGEFTYSGLTFKRQ